MAVLKFATTIKIRGINPYVSVSQNQANRLRAGWRKPMPVLVKVNSLPEEPWRINMMPVGDGDFYLYLHEYVRKTSNTKVGDKVIVEIQFDKVYRNGPLHPMPEKFSKALEQNPIAKANWDKLSPSRQKELLRYFAALKSVEAKQRNIEKALNVLSGKLGQFMGRPWNVGS